MTTTRQSPSGTRRCVCCERVSVLNTIHDYLKVANNRKQYNSWAKLGKAAAAGKKQASPKKPPKKAATMSPAKKIKMLKEDYDLGTIEDRITLLTGGLKYCAQCACKAHATGVGNEFYEKSLREMVEENGEEVHEDYEAAVEIAGRLDEQKPVQT